MKSIPRIMADLPFDDGLEGARRDAQAILTELSVELTTGFCEILRSGPEDKERVRLMSADCVRRFTQ